APYALTAEQRGHVHRPAVVRALRDRRLERLVVLQRRYLGGDLEQRGVLGVDVLALVGVVLGRVQRGLVLQEGVRADVEGGAQRAQGVLRALAAGQTLDERVHRVADLEPAILDVLDQLRA